MYFSYTVIRFSHPKVTVIKIEAKHTENMFTFYITATAVFTCFGQPSGRLAWLPRALSHPFLWLAQNLR